MSHYSPTAKKPFSRLSVRQLWVVVSIFAVAAAVWTYRLREAGREDDLFRAATKASLAARKLNTALLQAVRAKDSETVGELLEAGANPDYPDARLGPLQIAISNGDIDCVKLLVAAGASTSGHMHESPFLIAFHSQIEPSAKRMILRELFEHGADITQDQHVIDVGFGSGSPEIIALLRQRGAAYGPREMALADDIDGLRAALAGDPELLKRPLATYCMSSKSLLGVALRHGHEDLANWMLDEGSPLEVVF